MLNGAPPASESFPLGPDGRAECPVFLSQGIAALELEIYDGRVLLRKESIDPRANAFPGHIVLYHGLSSAAQKALGSFLFPLEPVQVAALDEFGLPAVALDYDGVGAVVLDGDGLSLNPAQRAAMAAFVAGGGVLALLGSRPERFKAFSPLPSMDGQERAVLVSGLGRVVLAAKGSASDPESRRPDYWRSLLGMGDYESSVRLSSSSLVSALSALEKAGPVGSADAQTPLPGPGPLAFMAAWGLAAFGILLARRWAPLFALGYIVLSLAGAFVAGRLIDARWMRGTNTQARLLVLPEGAGVVAMIGVSRPIADESGPDPSSAVPRLARLSFEGPETGHMDSRRSFAWRHSLRLPYLCLVSADRQSVLLSGILPMAALEGSPAAALAEAGQLGSGQSLPEDRGRSAYLILGADGGLRVLESSAWLAAETYPDWARPESAWLEGIRAALAGRDILVRYGSAPSLGFRVQGRAPDTALLALPLAQAGDAAGEGR